MSLDNASHPGRTGTDELVPSRYALRVGEIDVMVVSDGVLSLPGAMLGHNADLAVRAAWLNDMFLPPDVLEGSVVMQLKGGQEVTLTAGQTFYEGPDDVHLVDRNASSTKPAKFLVVLIKNKGAPAVVPVQ